MKRNEMLDDHLVLCLPGECVVNVNLFRWSNERTPKSTTSHCRSHLSRYLDLALEFCGARSKSKIKNQHVAPNMKEAQAVIAQRSKPKGNMTRTIVTMLVIMAGALLFAIINQIIKANKENANEVSANASPSNVASFEGDIITTISTAPASTSYIRTSSPTPSTPIAQSLDFPSTQTVKCVGPIQADDEGLFY